MDNTYRRFIIEQRTATRNGDTYLQTLINFPLLGYDEPRHPIHVLEERVINAVQEESARQNGRAKAVAAIERLLNSQHSFQFSHEQTTEDADRPFRGVFTLTVTLDGKDHVHTWKTPMTFAMPHEARKAGESLATAYKAAAGGNWPE